MNPLYLIPIGIGAAVLIAAAFLFGHAIEEKGYPNIKVPVILLCIFLPPVGYLLTCAYPDRHHTDEMKRQIILLKLLLTSDEDILQ